MTSRHSTIADKVFLTAILALTFVGCSKDSTQNNRRGQNAQLTPATIGGAMNSGVRANNFGSAQCNLIPVTGNPACDVTPNPANAGCPTSQYTVQSPCYDRNLFNQAAAAGTLPAATVAQAQAQVQNLIGPNGQLVNQSQAVNAAAQAISLDIPLDGSGKIINRHFRLVGGAGEETVTDNCHYLNPKDDEVQANSTDSDLNHLHKARFLYPQYDAFDLYFDNKGALTIRGQSINGQGITPATDGPVQYVLHDQPVDNQTIEVGAFRLIGAVRPEFAAMEKKLANELATLNDNNIADEMGITDGTNPGHKNSSSGLGGQSIGFSLGNTNGINNQNRPDPNGGFRAFDKTPLIETQAMVEIASSGFTGVISVYAPQPQHITQINIPEVPFNSKTFVSAQSNNCVGTGQGRLRDLHLQPAQ